MDSAFKISFRKNYGNLHIYVDGNFDGMCAWALIKVIKTQYNGTGRVFVSTEGFNGVMESGIELFKKNMTLKIMPLDRLFLKGTNGFKIGPNGCRVIICKRENRKHSLPRDPFLSLCRGRRSGRRQSDKTRI